MKTKKQLIVAIAIVLLSFTSKAQIVLPYYSGFDNSAQQTGWTEYKKAATTFSHWEIASASEYSAPNCLTHDFSPSAGISLTDNWYVSPAFSITSGGNLDSIRYRFSGFSEPLTGDTVAIYLLNGSQDPSLATSKQLLFDFRGTEYIADDVYRKLTDISLPAFSGLSYLAIRYRNTDCSSNWLTVFFDNVAISDNTAGTNELSIGSDVIEIYPNPFTASATLHVGALMNGATLTIFNSLGDRVKQVNNLYGHTIHFDREQLPSGLYYIRLTEDGLLISTSRLMLTDN